MRAWGLGDERPNPCIATLHCVTVKALRKENCLGKLLTLTDIFARRYQQPRMWETFDLRDTGGRDPALYAARSLESTIKIISGEKRLTRDDEKGASNYIDNLIGAKLIEVWEMEALKHFFTKVRNPIGHGPRAAPMPILTDHQTNWAIENSMIWIKSLIRRI